MNDFKYKFASVSGTVVLTLNVVGLAIVLIESYINNSFDTSKVILIAIISINIIRLLIVKPQKPETKPNGDFQAPPQTTDVE